MVYFSFNFIFVSIGTYILEPIIDESIFPMRISMIFSG